MTVVPARGPALGKRVVICDAFYAAGPSVKKKNLEIFKAAVDLASSGKFKNWKAVEEALVDKGVKRAPDLLDGDRIRAMIDLMCERSLNRSA